MGHLVRGSASFLSILFFVLSCPSSLFAQTTQVTGQVTDVSGLPYAGASMKAGLVFAGTPVSNPTVTINSLSQCKANGFGSAPCQVPFAPTNGPFNLDLQGNIPGGGITLQDNTQVTPSGTQWAFTVSTFGSPPPLGFGPQVCSATVTISGANQSVSGNFRSCPPLAPANLESGGGGGPSYLLGTVYGVNQPAKAIFDGTVNIGSAVITSAGQANWTSADIGSKIFVTNPCSATQCGYTTLELSQTILPSTQVTIARIASVQSSTQITVDCNPPGTCASPNASATVTGNAVVLWGQDQTAAINAAFNAAINTLGCPTVVYPQGLYFFSSEIWNTIPNNATNSCNGNGIHNLSQVLTVNGGGPTIEGQGPSSTIFVPTPDFNFSSCASGSGNCIGGVENETYEFFGISGFGQGMHNSGLQENLFGCGACSMRSVFFNGWMNAVGGSCGVNLTLGFNTLENVQAIGVGGTAGGLCVTGSQNVISNSSFGIAAGPAMSITGSGQLQTANDWFYVQNLTNAPEIDAGCSSWLSTNDQMIVANGLATAPSDDIKIENGCTSTIRNFNNNNTGVNDNGIEVVSGGVLRLGGYNTAAGKNKGITVASGGTFIDLGGNTPTYGSTTNSVAAGTSFSSLSTAGTVPVTGNFTLTNATFTSVTGADQKHFTLNITASAASPITIVYTFPIAFLTAPGSCHAQQVGGTNPILTFSTSVTQTTTAVTFLSTASATNTDTLQVAIDCQ